VLANNLNAA
jgi:chromosome segregation ATPase